MESPIKSAPSSEKMDPIAGKGQKTTILYHLRAFQETPHYGKIAVWEESGEGENQAQIKGKLNFSTPKNEFSN